MMMKRDGSAKGRSAAAGTAVGMALAVCLHLWDAVASKWFGMPIESVTAITYLAGMLAAFPFGWLLQFLFDWWDIGGANEYLLFLSSIVVNWGVLGYVWSYRSQR